METYVIELMDSHAYRLLQDLEALKIIKVLKKTGRKEQKAAKSNTARFRGALTMTDEQYQSIQQHVKDIRNEWRENI